MKKRIGTLLIATCFLATGAAAQDYPVDEGSYLIGGSISFTSQGGDLYAGADDERVNTFLINPNFHYFIVPNLAIGAEVLINRASQGDVSQTTFGIGPSVSYFFGGPESSIYPFVTAGPIYSRIAIDFGEESRSASGFGGRFSGGIASMLTRNVALTGEVFYLFESLKLEDAEESLSGNTFGIQFGVTAFIF